MKTLSKIILTGLMLFTPILANSNSDEIIKRVKSITDNAYFTFEKKSFLEASALCQRVLEKDKENTEAEYYLAYSAYRLSNIALMNQDKNEMSKYSELGKGYASALLEVPKYKSEAHTLLAAIIMMELAVEPSKGMELSGTIHSHIEKAISIDPDNPRAYLVKGIMLNNTPEMYGGGADRALPVLKRAKKAFNKQTTEALMPDWGQLENLAWLGQVLAKLGKYDEAKSIYEESLEINPEFYWVKYKLLPMVESKIAENRKEDQ